MIKDTKARAMILICILAVALGLRLWGLGVQEFVGDEGAYAFRSALYLDYLGTNFQTQPIDWYASTELPSWTQLSFHDHPPLGFLIRHWFFSIFGATPFVARLPGVLLGVCSIGLLYGILRRSPIFKDASESYALWGALLASVSGAMIWSSRAVLLEPFALFFILASLYAFTRFTEDRRWWWALGIALGLSLITKYTTIILLPVFLVYLLVYYRRIFRDVRLYGALLLALLFLSPVISYNFNLYKERGHFDLQLAYVFQQATPEWTGLLGKSEAPFREIGGRTRDLYGVSEIIIGLAGLGVIALFWKRANKKTVVLWAAYIIGCFGLFVLVGVAERFIVLLVPAMVALGAVLFGEMFDRSGKGIKKYIAPALLILIVFSGSTRYLANVYNTGVIELDQYLSKEFQDTSSVALPNTENPHLNGIIKKNAEAHSSGRPTRTLIVYSDTLALPSRLWLFDRRLLLEGIPVFYVEGFSEAVKANPAVFQGFSAYFMQATEYGFLNPFKKGNQAGNEFEKTLVSQGIEPVRSIYGHDGLPMFRVYTFTIES
jgi:4-amino-4-deoxy-L-arabinose transferase-like glycosyltransferase